MCTVSYNIFLDQMNNCRAAIAYTYAEKIGHTVYFKFSLFALLYSEITQRSERRFFNWIVGYGL